MSTAVAYDIRTEVPGPRADPRTAAITEAVSDERITAVLGDALAGLRPAFDPTPAARSRARARLMAAMAGAHG